MVFLLKSVVRKFGARAFHVGEVIFDSFVVRLQPLRHSSIESITHFCSRIIRRKMADYVILDIINGVQANEVDHHRVMKIVNVDAVSQVTSVSNARNDVFLMRRQVFLERRLHIDGKLPPEGFYRSKVFFSDSTNSGSFLRRTSARASITPWPAIWYIIVSSVFIIIILFVMISTVATVAGAGFFELELVPIERV